MAQTIEDVVNRHLALIQDLRAENERLKLEKDTQWKAVKVVTDDIFAAIGDADHVNENINIGVRRVVAERDALRDQLESAFKGVLCIRCTRHIAVPQINKTEHSGGECGACIVEERDALAAKVEQLREMLEKCRAFATMSPLTLEQLNTVLIETRPDAPPPTVVPDLHQTVSRNWQSELEHDNAVLRAALQRVWDEDECGFIIGPDDVECVKCGAPGKTDADIIHKSDCLQGFLQEALNKTSAVEVVPAKDFLALLYAAQAYFNVAQRPTISEEAQERYDKVSKILIAIMSDARIQAVKAFLNQPKP
jgi:hypothetical protein